MREAWSRAQRPSFAQPPSNAAHARLLERGWDWNTLVAGGSAGIATMPLLAVGHAVRDGYTVGALDHVARSGLADVAIALMLALFYVAVATAVGSVVIMAIGVPVAAVVWTVLRPVRARWIHVLVFAIVGAALVVVPTTGADVLEVLASPAPDLARGLASPGLRERLSELADLLVLAPYGIVSAAVSRVVAEAWAARTVRRHERQDAIAAIPDGTTRDRA